MSNDNNILNFSKFNSELKKLEFTAPGSKSITNRLLPLLLFANNQTAIKNLLFAEDTIVMLNAIYDLGVEFEYNSSQKKIYKKSQSYTPNNNKIYLGYAGTAYRFLLPLLLKFENNSFVLTGEPELFKRPITELTTAITQLVDGKIQHNSLTNELNINIKKIDISKKIIEIDANKSSQFLSALLLTLPMIFNELQIISKNEIISKTYIDLTLQILNDLDIYINNNDYKIFSWHTKQKPNFQEYNITGDFSSASYFFGISVLSKIQTKINNLDFNSKQGDKYIVNILEKMGCKIKIENNEISIYPPEKLKAAGIIDMSKMQDIVPTIAVISAFADGETLITNIENLKFKECDRFNAIITELQKIGVNISAVDNKTIKIIGNTNAVNTYNSAVFETYNDHRMAMALALTAIKIPNIKIKNPDCSCKTFPEFFGIFTKFFEETKYNSTDFYSKLYNREFEKFKKNNCWI